MFCCHGKKWVNRALKINVFCLLSITFVDKSSFPDQSSNFETRKSGMLLWEYERNTSPPTFISHLPEMRRLYVAYRPVLLVDRQL